MKIYAVFANRKSDPEIIELVTAWDEYSIEGNPDGWTTEVEKGCASWGEDLLSRVEVEIDVPMDEIEKALIPERIKVTGSVAIFTPPTEPVDDVPDAGET